MSDPFAHPWLGALFGDPELARLLSPEAELARMLRIEAAWARAVAPPDVAEALAARIEGCAIAPADLAAGTARDGLPVPALVAQLRQAVPEAERAWVHAGLTSQDVIDTALALALVDALPILAARLAALRSALAGLAARDGTRALMAMTRMQAALPITAGDRIAAWTAPLDDLAADLPRVAYRCARLQWGGPVGRRDPALPDGCGPAVAAALGLRDPGRAWHSDRGALADLAHLLSRLTGATGKIGQDVALMAQTGPAALRLSGGGASSAMAHKRNPVRAELLVTLARYTAGHLAQMHHALLHEQERSGAAWMLEWLVLPGMLKAAGRSLTAAAELTGEIAGMGAPD